MLGPALSSLTSLEQAPLPSDPAHTRTLGALSLCAAIVSVFSLPRQPLGEQGTQLNGASRPQHGSGPGSGINIRRPDDQMTVPGGGWHCHTLCLEDTSQRQAHNLPCIYESTASATSLSNQVMCPPQPEQVVF